MPRIVQIDDYVKKEIAKVKSYAAEHPYNEEALISIKTETLAPPGDNPDHVVHIHDGFRAVYSVNVLKYIKYHHLSISYERGMIGVPEAELILKMFGIAEDIMDLDHVYIEEKHQAVNLIKEFK